MNIKNIKGTTLKKLMNAERSNFRYHNKNKSGGNFAIEMRGIEGKDYEIWVHYGSDGNFYHIHFGYVYNAGIQMNLDRMETIEELCIRLKKVIEIQKSMDKKFHEMQEVA